VGALEDALAGGPDGFFCVVDDQGRSLRFVPDDFDEIWTTTDRHEAARHASTGWLPLDEVAAEPAGDTRGLLQRAFDSGIGEGVGWDRRSSDGVDLGIGPGRPFPGGGAQPEGETTYILGHLRPGRQGRLLP
jgi:hypothetical protein